MHKKIMPTTYLFAALLLCTLLHFILPIARIIPTPWILLGLIPLVLGVWINIAADRAFHQAQTTVKPFERSSALLQEGIFRWTRNPMYLGFMLILLGVNTLLGTLSPFLVIVPFGVLMELLFIREEERMLEAIFGDAWRRYRSKVRKWL
jgi:protein-S-isoprenylcysteine O-methyltransferase Ste14